MQISNNHLEGINSSMNITNSSMNITNNSVNEQQFASVDSNMVEQHNKIESQQDSKEGQWGESKDMCKRNGLFIDEKR